MAWFRPFEGLRRVLATSLGLGVVTAILTSILGLYRSFGGDYSAEILALHRNTGLALTVVAALTLVLHSAVLRVGNLWLGWYRASLGLTLVLLLIASHHGGSLTHGQGFLTQNAPPVIRGWMARWGRKSPARSLLSRWLQEPWRSRKCSRPSVFPATDQTNRRESFVSTSVSRCSRADRVVRRLLCREIRGDPD